MLRHLCLDSFNGVDISITKVNIMQRMCSTQLPCKKMKSSRTILPQYNLFNIQLTDVVMQDIFISTLIALPSYNKCIVKKYYLKLRYFSQSNQFYSFISLCCQYEAEQICKHSYLSFLCKIASQSLCSFFRTAL